jgi:hypothetical protein
MDSPSTNKQGPRAPSSQASPARFRFVIGADAVYRSTRLRRYGIRSEPHKMNGRLEMSTGLEFGSGSGRAGGLPVGDRRSRRRRRHQELRLPAARRRAQEEARLEGGHSGVVRTELVWSFSCLRLRFVRQLGFPCSSLRRFL